MLGKFVGEAGRGVFRLSSAVARKLAQDRIALIGEAAHVIHADRCAGSLNLGLRDAAMVGEFVVSARRDGEDIGSPDVLARYDNARRADVTTRAFAVDLFNRSLLTDFLPMQGARGLGLYMLGQIGPLRRAVLREGVSPAASQPKLMRGEAL